MQIPIIDISNKTNLVALGRLDLSFFNDTIGNFKDLNASMSQMYDDYDSYDNQYQVDDDFEQPSFMNYLSGLNFLQPNRQDLKKSLEHDDYHLDHPELDISHSHSHGNQNPPPIIIDETNRSLPYESYCIRNCLCPNGIPIPEENCYNMTINYGVHYGNACISCHTNKGYIAKYNVENGILIGCFKSTDYSKNIPIYVWVIIGVVAIIVIGFIFVYCMYIYNRKIQNKIKDHINQGILDAHKLQRQTTDERTNPKDRNSLPTLSSDILNNKQDLKRIQFFKNFDGTIPNELKFLPEKYLIQKENLKIDERKCLGSGEYGQVYYGQIKYDKHDDLPINVACKIMRGSTYNDIMKFCNEASISYDVREHRHILGLVGVYCPDLSKDEVMNDNHNLGAHQESSSGIGSTNMSFEPNYFSFKNLPIKCDFYHHFILMTPLMDKGNLLAYLKHTNQEITIRKALNYCYQAALGLEYLHNVNIIHGDFACRNLLLNKNGLIKVSDFGKSEDAYEYNYQDAVKKKAKNDLDREALNPWRWLPPELYVTGRLDNFADIWAFGITMWEIFSKGRTPYAGVKNFYAWIQTENYRLPLIIKCPISVYLLMIRCWLSKKTNRPMMKNIIASLNNFDIESENYKIQDLDEVLRILFWPESPRPLCAFLHMCLVFFT